MVIWLKKHSLMTLKSQKSTTFMHYIPASTVFEKSCVIRSFLIILIHSQFCDGVRVLPFLVFCVCYYVSLRFEFRLVRSVTISAWKWCSVRLYLQLFEGELMSYLRYLCLFVCNDVQHILCCVFLRIVYPMLPVSLDFHFFVFPFGII